MTTTEPRVDRRDPATERTLDHHHIPYTYDEAFPLDDIDITKSISNQARIGDPLLDEVVEQYEHDYRRGDPFPPLLLHRPTPRTRKLVALGGNHRRAAATRAGLEVHPVYIVEALEPDVAIALAYQDNATHGARLTRADRMTQAAHLVALGWTQGDSARCCGITPGDVSKAVAIAEGGHRAHQHDLAGEWARLPHGHKERLANVRSDPAFTESVRLVDAAKLTQADVASLVRNVNGARTDEAALTTVGNIAEEHQGALQRAAFGKQNKAQRTPYHTLAAALGQITAIDPAKVANTITNPDQKALIRRRINEAAKALMVLDQKLGARR